MGFLLGLDTAPMEARSVAELPAGEGWQFEPKWDGFRCLAFKCGVEVELRAKSGKPLGRYFPEIVAAVSSAPVEDCVLDGELTIALDGALSFNALQDRLHPAESRIRKLAAATPAQLILFDCLATAREGMILARPFAERRAVLEALFPGLGGPFRLTPFTTALAAAQSWLDSSGGDVDGVVAKRTDAAYQPGERAMLKVKRLRTADCVVGGYRYGVGSNLVGSLLLGLYNAAGQLDHVGFTSSLSVGEKHGLTKKLEALRGGSGFTGEAPGGPSRWSDGRSADWERVRPELVVEVRYDHVTGHKFRHGTRLVRWRPDKRPDQCTLEQLCRDGRGDR